MPASLVWLLASLALAPVVILLLHMVIHRGCRLIGRPLMPHASAVLAIAGGQAAVAVVLLRTRRGWAGEPFGWGGALVYELVVYAALAILYLDVVNIAETSLHVHIVLEIAWAGRVPVDALAARYGGSHMVDARLDRLMGLGQIGVDGERYVLRNRKLLVVARVLDAWRRLLGLPT